MPEMSDEDETADVDEGADPLAPMPIR